MSVSGSTFDLGRHAFSLTSGGTLTSTTANPLISLVDTTLKAETPGLQTNFFQVYGGGGAPPPSASLNGPLLSATDSSITVSADFLRVVNAGELTSTGTTPLVQLTNTPVVTTGSGLSPGEVFGNFVFVCCSVGGEGSISLAGPLLDATNSDLTLLDSFIQMTAGTLTTTSASPLVLLSGGTHTITDDLFDVEGQTITDQPIKGSQPAFTVNGKTASNPIGALFKATNGADINVEGAIGLDSALFEATLPVVELVGSSSTQTKITSSSTFAEIEGASGSKLLLKGPVISLDNGLIKVNSGPLLSLRNGSTMDVSGNLLKLINGSTINVVNGPAIKVDGSGSALNATGALLDFGNTSGNTFIINNTISPTATISGIPVSEGTSGSISIGSNPIINNPGGNTITITGSVISTGTVGGSVNISAP